MQYAFRFYRFASLSAFLAAWAEAGLPLEEGAPALPGGALDVIGAVEGAPGFHVNAAWRGAAAPALEARAIAPFEGLRVFAGWRDAAPPAPVPESATNWQVRAELRETFLPDGRSLERAVDELLRAGKAAAAVLPDTDPARIGADTAWLAWEQANDFTRRGQLVAAVAAQFGWGEAELDALFRRAATREA